MSDRPDVSYHCHTTWPPALTSITELTMVLFSVSVFKDSLLLHCESIHSPSLGWKHNASMILFTPIWSRRSFPERTCMTLSGLSLALLIHANLCITVITPFCLSDQEITLLHSGKIKYPSSLNRYLLIILRPVHDDHGQLTNRKAIAWENY